MDLSKYDGKYVRAWDVYGGDYTGVADYRGSEYCLHEYGVDEDAVIIEDVLIYASQIASIEETAAHGSAELRTPRLILRAYRPEDAEELYRGLGTDPSAYEFSGWNPYADPETARRTVTGFIESREDGTYSWVMDVEGAVAGTVGACDREDDRIEIGFSVVKSWQGRGLATEAVKRVLEHLTENEGFTRVDAWCASENHGSRRVLEKAGMRLVNTEKDGLEVGGRVYDKLTYQYRKIR